FWVNSPTTLARAVSARPRSSSSGSSPDQGRWGRATLTSTARSRCTVMSSRVSFKYHSFDQIEFTPALALRAGSSFLQRPSQQLVKIISASFALDAESPGVIRPALQAALDLVADADVLELHLVGDGDTLLVERFRLVTVHIGEIEIEQHPATVRSQRQ